MTHVFLLLLKSDALVDFEDLLCVRIFWVKSRLLEQCPMPKPPILTERTSRSARTPNAGYTPKASGFSLRTQEQPCSVGSPAPRRITRCAHTTEHTGTYFHRRFPGRSLAAPLLLLSASGFYGSVQQPVLLLAEHVKTRLRLSEVILRDPGFGCYFQAVLKMLEF